METENFYVSFGHGKERHWADARKYGYISAGHGRWYSNTLNSLEVGSRVWVNIPGNGYVGVGEVICDICQAENYQFKEFDNKTINELSTDGNYSSFESLDDDNAEYLAPEKWHDTKPLKSAFSKTGLFGNQNSVCKPTTPKCSHTIERLKAELKYTNN